MGRFVVNRIDCVGEEPMISFDDLAAALTERDRLRELPCAGRVMFRVVDRENPEVGGADWCEECGRATFGGTCRECWSVFVVELSNPYHASDTERWECEDIAALADRIEDVTGWSGREAREAAREVAALGKDFHHEDTETGRVVTARALERVRT